MHDEATHRRDGFREGRAIPLADGRAWIFPPPPEGADPDHDAMVEAVLEAEDRAERQLAELALAMGLLARNYDLDPADYRALFGFRPGGPALEAAREAFRALALEHAPEAEAEAEPEGPRRADPRRAGGRLRGGLARVAAWF